MLGKKAGYNQRIGAACHQHDRLAFTQAGAGCGGAFGIGGGRKQIQLVLLEEGGKIGTVQQNRDFYRFQPLPQGVNGLLRGKGAVIAQAVFCLSAGVRGADFHCQRAGAELPPQQGNIIAQKLGEGLLRTAQIALPGRR